MNGAPPSARGAEWRAFGGEANRSLASGHQVVSATLEGRTWGVEFDVDAPTGPVTEVELRLR